MLCMPCCAMLCEHAVSWLTLLGLVIDLKTLLCMQHQSIMLQLQSTVQQCCRQGACVQVFLTVTQGFCCPASNSHARCHSMSFASKQQLLLRSFNTSTAHQHLPASLSPGHGTKRCVMTLLCCDFRSASAGCVIEMLQSVSSGVQVSTAIGRAAAAEGFTSMSF
jgi:hypothetical protein